MANETKGTETRTGHTPGPWSYEHPALSFEVNTGNIHVAEVLAKVPAGLSDRYVLEDEAEANACLIAAAPELLAVCERVVRDSERGVLTIDTVTLAKDAIAKAEGRR